MISIHGLLEKEIQDHFVALGEKPFRAKQILNWLYERGVDDWDKMTDLGKDLRTKLKELFSFKSLSLEKTQHSDDGETIKFLWKLEDGKLVESVLICSEDRRTVCVSSQVG